MMMDDLAQCSRFPAPESKQDPKVLFIPFPRTATSVIAAIEAVVVVVVVMMAIISPIPRYHHDRRVIIATAIEAVMVVMMMVVMVELSELDVVTHLWRCCFVDGLEQGAGVRNRLQQVGV